MLDVEEQESLRRAQEFRERVSKAIVGEDGYFARQEAKARREAEGAIRAEARRQEALTRAARGLPEKKSEAQEQREVLKWLKTVAGLHDNDYAANSEGVYHGDAVRGAISKANGVKKGRPDLEIWARVPNHPEARGVVIEMKSLEGRLRPDQREFLGRFVHNGYLAHTAYGAEDAIRFLGSLGFGR